MFRALIGPSSGVCWLLACATIWFMQWCGVSVRSRAVALYDKVTARDRPDTLQHRMNQKVA
jgi:hypothetical protein